MKLHVVRHGQTKENENKIFMGHQNGTLTSLGKQQMEETAQKLVGTKFVHMFSSDLQRCVDSAEILKEYYPNTPLTFTSALREANLGVFQGKHYDEVDWDSLGDDVMNRKPKGGESLNEVRERVSNFIQELLERHSNDTLLLVTHGGIVRQLLSMFSHEDDQPFYKMHIDNGGIYTFEVNDDIAFK